MGSNRLWPQASSLPEPIVGSSSTPSSDQEPPSGHWRQANTENKQTNNTVCPHARSPSLQLETPTSWLQRLALPPSKLCGRSKLNKACYDDNDDSGEDNFWIDFFFFGVRFLNKNNKQQQSCQIPHQTGSGSTCAAFKRDYGTPRRCLIVSTTSLGGSSRGCHLNVMIGDLNILLFVLFIC